MRNQQRLLQTKRELVAHADAVHVRTSALHQKHHRQKAMATCKDMHRTLPAPGERPNIAGQCTQQQEMSTVSFKPRVSLWCTPGSADDTRRSAATGSAQILHTRALVEA